ncbi:MAG TPA: hypothetical protein VGP47_07475 [Parachlamydiaceae bacterium]|nr:hypothetical protein [Parachlamydiaceae bacterium]
MQVPDGNYSSKIPEINKFERIQRATNKPFHDKILSLQQRINTFCTDEFRKTGTSGEVLKNEIKQNLIVTLASFVNQKDPLSFLLKKQIVLINDIFDNTNPSNQEKLYKEIKNSTIEIGKLLNTNPKLPVNTHEVENLNKQSTVVTSSIKQVNVLNQNADETGVGEENCGYHALKNALCLMTAILSKNNYNTGVKNNSFLDLNLFTDFYQTYAAPLLKGKEKGDKDASDPLVREMINAFLTDTAPPERLLSLKNILKNNRHGLGIFTLFPSDNEAGLKLAVMDEYSFRDCLKFFKFSQNKEITSLICPVGNVASMHWYSIAMIKKEDGSLHFFGCDSFESNQKGIASPLGKVCKVFEQAMENPTEFFDSALFSFVEGFERYADWLDASGVPDSEESEASLMELAKSPPNLPEICALALENMIEHNWQNSSDIKKLLQFQRVEKLANFYAK